MCVCVINAHTHWIQSVYSNIKACRWFAGWRGELGGGVDVVSAGGGYTHS